MAMLLWAGPEAALSHRSAATLWGLEGFPPVHWAISVTGTPKLPRGVAWFSVHAACAGPFLASLDSGSAVDS